VQAGVEGRDGMYTHLAVGGLGQCAPLSPRLTASVSRIAEQVRGMDEQRAADYDAVSASASADENGA
jgi:hypothetical protein